VSVCNCPAYSWPHRRTGGKCIWNPQHSEDFCEECGQKCRGQSVRLEPEERGPLVPERALMSDCCGSAVIRGGQIRTWADEQLD